MRKLLAFASALVAISVDASPWTPARQLAVVRLEIPLSGSTRPQVASGFIVQGQGELHYVVTTTHALTVLAPEGEPACRSLPHGLRMLLGSRNGREVVGRCAIHVGSDISLIQLDVPSVEAPAYPTLQLNGREVARHERLYFAGFPFGREFTDREAEISILSGADPNDMVVVESLSARGMSGGPYLETDGTVVGVHHGQEDSTAGWGFLIAISAVRSSLEPFVRRVAIGPAPNLVYSPSGSDCSGASVVKAFLKVPVNVREAVYRELCQNADPAVVELLKLTPYQPSVVLATAPSSSFPQLTSSSIVEARPPGFAVEPARPMDYVALDAMRPFSGDLGIFSMFPQNPTSSAERQLVASVESSLKMSTTTCLDEAKVTVFRGLLNCHNESQFFPTPNVGGANKPAVVVLHATSTATGKSTMAALTSPNFSASAHVLIERDGSFVQLVSFDRAAWHAGSGAWNGMTGLNSKSVGIEMVNAGRLTRMDDGTFTAMGGVIVPASEVEMVDDQPWHRYTTEQLAAVVAIGKALTKAYAITAVVGHCDVQPGRKSDPGPAFPIGPIEGYILDIRDRRAACPSA